MTHTVQTIAHYLQSAISETLFSVTKIASTVSDTMKLFSAKMKEASLRRRTINELRSMSDYELSDIGISRGDIYSVARGDPDMERSFPVNDNLKGSV